VPDATTDAFACVDGDHLPGGGDAGSFDLQAGVFNHAVESDRLHLRSESVESPKPVE
jgi:hypothetical protein